MSRSLYLPEGYAPALSLRETQHAIKYIKDVFQQALSIQLMLDRVSAPLIVRKGSGINDDLNGVERKVSFDIKEIDCEAEVVQSLAKWKRMALYRYGYKADSGFVTSRGQPIRLKDPECASKAQVEYIRQFVQDAEDAIYSEDGYNSKGKHYSDYIDVDSMIKCYLMKEISMDADGTMASLFLWKDSDLKGDGKLHFSPVWDFDFAYGSFSSSKTNSDGDYGHTLVTENLYAICCPISGYGEDSDTLGISWFCKLYKTEDYRKRVAKIYFDDFYPFACQLSDPKDPYVQKMGAEILPAANMNNQRWHTYGGFMYCVFGSASGLDYPGSIDRLRGFLYNRKRWLTSLWQPDVFVKGDVNMDGGFDMSDLVMTQKWLLQPNCPDDPYWQAGDFLSDGKFNMYDLILMKQELVGETK